MRLLYTLAAGSLTLPSACQPYDVRGTGQPDGDPTDSDLVSVADSGRSGAPHTDAPGDPGRKPERCELPGPDASGWPFAFRPDQVGRGVSFENPDGNAAIDDSLTHVDIDGDGRLELGVQVTLDTEPSWFGLITPPTLGLHPASAVAHTVIHAAGGYGYRPAGLGNLVDLDGDGTAELFGRGYLFYNTFHQPMAWTLPVGGGTKKMEPHDWLFYVEGWTRVFGDMITGDWNGDGVTDVLVTGNYKYLVGSDLLIASGPFPPGDVDLARSTYAHMHWPGPYNPLFAGSTALDLNGDGVTDLAWNEYGDGTGGDVHVLFGPLAADLAKRAPDVVFSSSQPANDDGTVSFGALRVVGDVNGDGHADVIISSQGESDHRDHVGAAFLFLGPFRAGDRLHDTDAYAKIQWPHAFAYTGWIAALGDVDGDGRDDFAVSAWGARRDLQPPDAMIPLVDLPWDGSAPVREVHTDAPLPPEPTPYPVADAEGVIMVFADPPPGVIGPAEAGLILEGGAPGAILGFWGLAATGDLDGDGLGELAVYARDPADAYDHRLWFVSPCNDFKPTGP